MARRKLHDQYFQKAKAEGYAARSAYKLKQIQESKRLIRPGDAVLDLGCSPGSWLQVASELVGSEGIVVGIDLNPVRIALPSGVVTLVGDITEIDPALLTEPLGEDRRFDVVLSDMAPKTIGHADAERSISLCHDVLAILPRLLKPTGNLAMKVLEGSGYADLIDTTRLVFADARGFKPRASRDVSREMYVIGKGYLPQ